MKKEHKPLIIILGIFLVLGIVGSPGEKLASFDDSVQVVPEFEAPDLLLLDGTLPPVNSFKKEAFFTCSDSDGGIDYYQFGTVNDPLNQKWNDECINSLTLKETYCSGGIPDVDFITVELKSNGWECKNGQFQKKDVCIDTDGGKLPYLKGTVTLGSTPHTDICIDASTVREYFCQDCELKQAGYGGSFDITQCVWQTDMKASPGGSCSNGQLISSSGGTGGDTTTGCTISIWSGAEPYRVCSSEPAYIRESNCKTTKIVKGTKTCAGNCDPDLWTPSTSGWCSSQDVVQGSDCGTTRTVPGTKVCGDRGCSKDSDCEPGQECTTVGKCKTKTEVPSVSPSEPVDWNKYIPWAIGIFGVILLLSFMKKN